MSHLKDHVLSRLVVRAQLLTERPQILGDEELVAESADLGVALGEDHLDQVDCDSEERPPVVHVSEHLQILDVFADHLIHRGPKTEPDWEMEPRLCPRKYPRDRSKRLYATTRLSLRRTAPNVHPAILQLGRRLKKNKANETRRR